MNKAEEYISWGDMSEKEKQSFLNHLHLKLRKMGKAEKFISDCTRNCSNEIDYAQINRRGWTHFTPVIDFSPWLTPDQARKAVEIAKEEVIEKACEWLLKNVTYTHPRKGTKECIVNISIFKQAMKDG